MYHHFAFYMIKKSPKVQKNDNFDTFLDLWSLLNTIILTQFPSKYDEFDPTRTIILHVKPGNTGEVCCVLSITPNQWNNRNIFSFNGLTLVTCSSDMAVSPPKNITYLTRISRIVTTEYYCTSKNVFNWFYLTVGIGLGQTVCLHRALSEFCQFCQNKPFFIKSTS